MLLGISRCFLRSYSLRGWTLMRDALPSSAVSIAGRNRPARRAMNSNPSRGTGSCVVLLTAGGEPRLPCLATIKLAMQSGTLVPAARKVMPMMTSGIPSVYPTIVTCRRVRGGGHELREQPPGPLLTLSAFNWNAGLLFYLLFSNIRN